MENHKAGLSPNEREFIQDFGEVGRLNDSFRLYKHRIKHKIHPTLTDAILILKYSNNVDLLEFVKTDCREDLIILFDLLAKLLTVDVSEIGNAVKPLTSE